MRREFLKLGAAAAAGLGLPGRGRANETKTRVRIGSGYHTIELVEGWGELPRRPARDVPRFARRHVCDRMGGLRPPAQVQPHTAAFSRFSERLIDINRGSSWRRLSSPNAAVDNSTASHLLCVAARSTSNHWGLELGGVKIVSVRINNIVFPYLVISRS